MRMSRGRGGAALFASVVVAGAIATAPAYANAGKVLVFAVTVILIHCYHGYTASGGPAGVGVAVGRAVRTSIVALNVIDLFLSMAIWGASTTVRLAG